MKKSIKLLYFLLTAMLVSACAPTTQNYSRPAPDLKKASQLNAELGIGYLQQNNLAEVKHKLDKALSQDSDNPLANNAFGRLNARLGKPQVADEYFLKSIDLAPENASFANTYAIFLCSQDRLSEAEKQFNRAASNKLYKTPEFALDNAGLCAYQAVQYKKAEYYYQLAIQAQPDFAQALFHLAQVKYKRLQHHRAETYLARYHKLAKESPASLLLGIYIQQALGHKKASDALGTKLLKKFPASTQATSYLKSSSNSR